MFYMVTSTYPNHKYAEVAQVYQKSTPLPSFMKLLHLFMRSDMECGYKAYSTYEVEAGKEYEGMWAIAAGQAPFNAIEGYRWHVDVVVTPEELAARAAARATT